MVQVARSGEAQKAFLGSSRLWSTRYEVARPLIYRGKGRLKEFGNSHAIID